MVNKSRTPNGSGYDNRLCLQNRKETGITCQNIKIENEKYINRH